MRQLIEDLLTFSSVGRSASDAEEVDLDDLLGQVLADLEATIEATGAEVAPRAAADRVGAPCRCSVRCCRTSSGTR